VLTGAEVQKSIDELPADLSPFGLDKPGVVVAVSTASGQTSRLQIGKTTAIGAKAYVRRGDESKLLLTASSVPGSLTKQVKDLRDKQVISFQDDAVQRIEIAPHDGPAVTLVRVDKDAWTVNPGEHPADPTEVKSYLSSLRSTRALDFPDDHPGALAPYGLDPPQLTITLALDKEGTKTLRLLIGSETTQGSQKQVYAKNVDAAPIYALGDWAVRGFTKTAGQLRDKVVLGFDPSRVYRLTLSRKDGETSTLTRDDKGTWQLEGGASTAAKEAAVQRFLDDLRDLRGSDIAAEPAGDLSRFALDAPDLRIVLADKDGQPLGTVLAAKKDAKYYAVRDGGQTVYETRDYMFSRLDKHRTDFVQGAAPTPGAASGSTPPSSAPPNDGADEGDDGDD